MRSLSPLVALGLALLPAPVIGQHHIRQRDYPTGEPTAAQVAADRLPVPPIGSALPGSASDAELDAMAAAQCAADVRPFCRSLMAISRDGLAQKWADEARPRYRAGLALSIARASRKGPTDWAEAESQYEIWVRKLEDPDYDRRMAALAGYRSRPRIESNCAVDTWQEGNRIRSRAWCW